MRKYKLYTPYKMESMSEKEIRKAYSELRKVANKRLANMRKHNIGMRAREGFVFPTLKEIEESSKYTVESALADVSSWLRSDRTTVKGEKKAVAEFRNVIGAKYPELVKDLDSTYMTMEFLDYMREKYTAKLYDSGDVLDVLQKAQYLNIGLDKLKENIKLFYDHKAQFEKIKNPKRKGYTPVAVDRLIAKYEKEYIVEDLQY